MSHPHAETDQNASSTARVDRCRQAATDRFSALVAYDDGMTLLDWISRTRPRAIDLEDAAEALGTSDLVRAFWATVVLSESDHPVLDREITVVSGASSDLGSDCAGIRMNFGVRLADGVRHAA